MHEVAIADALIEQVQSEIDRAEASGRVTRVSLVVGRLSGVNPDSLRFALDLLVKGTILESARIEIAEPAAQCQCAACGCRTEIEDLEARCPSCGSSDITIEGGRDLLLESIELEENQTGLGS
jgi:hydrogenase nickel incorporation protein HypA/HybF